METGGPSCAVPWSHSITRLLRLHRLQTVREAAIAHRVALSSGRVRCDARTAFRAVSRATPSSVSRHPHTHAHTHVKAIVSTFITWPTCDGSGEGCYARVESRGHAAGRGRGTPGRISPCVAVSRTPYGESKKQTGSLCFRLNIPLFYL
jgi:hypothetical protein